MKAKGNSMINTDLMEHINNKIMINTIKKKILLIIKGKNITSSNIRMINIINIKIIRGVIEKKDFIKKKMVLITILIHISNIQVIFLLNLI